MRLKTIKLAGFKSFVDPTTVNMVSNMCAVVGPNGCGKSNIIDAVRWVMGESSAKNLRGESMTDVIFNGSGSRKPTGQATIELIFDNSDGTLTGEYAAYTEISIKRRVTRDAQNLYYLNGNRCRRRDITDIFLGTGLGPRSYAIIEQGMISRLIDAKPEDLRIYIEEAAGISKYKERRRDTENRMKRTHENLERLTDLREELERQIVRLERQAKSAEKYGLFKEEERLLKSKLTAIRYQVLQLGAEGLKKRISEAELNVEAAVTQRVKFDAAIERHRIEFSEKSDHFNEVQGQFYALGADIARIEQSIKHTAERERTLRVDLEQTARDCKEAEEHLSIDTAKIEGWEAELLEISPELEMIEQSLEDSHNALADAEEAMQTWQQEWDQFNQNAAGPKQAAEVQQSRIQYLDQVQTRLIQRKEKIQAETADIDIEEDQEEIALQEEELASKALSVEDASVKMSEQSETIADLREQHAEKLVLRDKEQGELQTRRGRLASLEALQSAALGKDGDKRCEQWLQAQSLDSEPRLAEKIKVDKGWEKALEIVLSQSLQAVVTHQDLSVFLDSVTVLESSVELFSTRESTKRVANDTQYLVSKVESELDLESKLNGILVAENLSEAYQLLSNIQSHESVVTKDGYWLGQSWLRVTRQSDEESGVIARKQAIDELIEAIESQEKRVETIVEALQSIHDQLKALEELRESTRRELEQYQRELQSISSEIHTKKSKIDQLLQSKARAISDIAEIDNQLSLESENLAEARAQLEEAIIAIENDSDAREHLLTRRDTLRAALDDARQKSRHTQDKNHELAMRHRSIQAQLDSMRQGIQRLNEQIARMQERRDQLRDSLEEAATPGEENQIELETLLEKRVSIEHKLTESRASVEETETALRDAEKSRDGTEKSIGDQRSTLESARLELKTLDVKAQNIQQQFETDELDMDEVMLTLSEEDSEDALMANIEQVANRISRLGPINLAAIEEFKIESERKNYLDEQNDDLYEALETLESAIKKIDKETRTRFKETFDQVNTGLQELFPRLFGGGHAYLELTGEDMLDTGVAIMARPPGKKNSTIHLLSGGEKALTAIALVFSIFRLNPAPFCMLDEVDAPLDDANVGRYANMVESMSEHVQFIYITHNKIAMEKAQHLLGVTMQEAGVSRMVTVDVEEAAELAAM